MLLSPRRAVGMLRLYLRHNGVVGIRAFCWHKSAGCPIVITASKRQCHRRWGSCRTTQHQGKTAETVPSTTLMPLRQTCVSMRRHIIVAGDDALATTIVEELNNAGAHVVKLANAAGLADAGVAHALSVVCAGDDDATNLEIALLARNANPNVRVVARLANDVLREAVADGNGPWGGSGRRRSRGALGCRGMLGPQRAPVRGRRHQVRCFRRRGTP